MDHPLNVKVGISNGFCPRENSRGCSNNAFCEDEVPVNKENKKEHVECTNHIAIEVEVCVKGEAKQERFTISTGCPPHVIHVEVSVKKETKQETEQEVEQETEQETEQGIEQEIEQEIK